MNCKETFLDIVAVWPLPKGFISYDIPFNVRKREYMLSELKLNDNSAIDSLFHYSISDDNIGTGVVELEEQESTLKSTSTQTVAGIAFDVVISLIIKENSSMARRLGEQLENNCHDFIVKSADSGLLLVRAEDYAYECQTNEEFDVEYTLRHTIKIQNVNGIIRLTT